MRVIPEEQVLRRIAAENPWWKKGEIQLPFRRWRPRPYLALFDPLVANRNVRRALVLMGPRRVGKTVMIHHEIQQLIERGIAATQIGYFSVDHPLYTGLGLDDFLRLFEQASGTDPADEETFLFFDEIQYLRDWEIHLKAIVDHHPAIKAIASGSAAAALKLKSIESGAGRLTDFLLPPLTFHEYLSLLASNGETQPELVESEDGFFRAANIDDLNRSFLHYLNFGGYPEVIFSPEIQAEPSRFIKADIIDKVLLRDLPSLYGIQDIQELNYLFTTLAFNTAGEVSLQQLSKGSGVAKNTLKRYIEYLEAAFLIKVVHRVDHRGKRFQRANFFKVYLTNPSIRSALFAPVGPDDPAIGSLVESAIFAQWFHSDQKLHYARWKNGEVDIVSRAATGEVEWAVEVKWSDRVIDNPKELTSIQQFARENELQRATVTTRTRRLHRSVGDLDVEFLPASEYCYTVGHNLIRRKSVPALS